MSDDPGAIVRWLLRRGPPAPVAQLMVEARRFEAGAAATGDPYLRREAMKCAAMWRGWVAIFGGARAVRMYQTGPS